MMPSLGYSERSRGSTAQTLGSEHIPMVCKSSGLKQLRGHGD